MPGQRPSWLDASLENWMNVFHDSAGLDWQPTLPGENECCEGAERWTLGVQHRVERWIHAKLVRFGVRIVPWSVHMAQALRTLGLSCPGQVILHAQRFTPLNIMPGPKSSCSKLDPHHFTRPMYCHSTYVVNQARDILKNLAGSLHI